MAERLSLTPATPDEIIASQAEAVRIKRQVLRGKLWLRRRAGRAVPDYPGLDLEPSAADRLAGLRDLAEETLLPRRRRPALPLSPDALVARPAGTRRPNAGAPRARASAPHG